MSKSWSEVIENIDLSTKPLREPRKLSCDEITDLKEKCNPKYDLTILDLICTIESLQQENEQLQEFANAKADGRMVVLPCKIGDEVWFLEKQFDIANGTCSTVISEYIVTEIRGNKYNPLWYMASSERCTHRDFHPTELGKTVFLTKEEAEKALEVRE